MRIPSPLLRAFYTLRSFTLRSLTSLRLRLRAKSRAEGEGGDGLAFKAYKFRRKQSLVITPPSCCKHFCSRLSNSLSRPSKPFLPTRFLLPSSQLPQPGLEQLWHLALRASHQNLQREAWWVRVIICQREHRNVMNAHDFVQSPKIHPGKPT